MFVDSSDLLLDDLGNNCLLFVHSKKTANDQEGEGVIRAYRSLGDQLGEYRQIVITDGGGPSSAQRQRMQAEFGDALKLMPTAVLSDAITVRFVISSLRLFMKNIKAFEARDVPGALEFAGVPADAQDTVRKRLQETAGKVPAGRFRTLDAMLDR